MIAHLGQTISSSANVLLDIGVFHFQVIGNINGGSGWENVVFQSGFSFSSILLAVFFRSHYNRAWIEHSSKIFLRKGSQFFTLYENLNISYQEKTNYFRFSI